MVKLAENHPGDLSMGALRGADAFEITISYWEKHKHIFDWKDQDEHQANEKQRSKVERKYSFERENQSKA